MYLKEFLIWKEWNLINEWWRIVKCASKSLLLIVRYTKETFLTDVIAKLILFFVLLFFDFRKPCLVFFIPFHFYLTSNDETFQDVAITGISVALQQYLHAHFCIVKARLKHLTQKRERELIRKYPQLMHHTLHVSLRKCIKKRSLGSYCVSQVTFYASPPSFLVNSFLKMLTDDFLYL